MSVARCIEAQDSFAHFVGEKIIRDATAMLEFGVVFEAYIRWCAAVNMIPLTERSFARFMRGVGYIPVRYSKQTVYPGITLRW